jgi:hypothetical protein
LINRGTAYLTVKDYDHAIVGFYTVIELDRTMRIAYIARVSDFMERET